MPRDVSSPTSSPRVRWKRHRQKLVDRGLFVYSVESRGGRLADLVRQKSGRQVGGSEFLILNQQFNTLIKAGLPILKSLRTFLPPALPLPSYFLPGLLRRDSPGALSQNDRTKQNPTIPERDQTSHICESSSRNLRVHPRLHRKSWIRLTSSAKATAFAGQLPERRRWERACRAQSGPSRLQRSG